MERGSGHEAAQGDGEPEVKKRRLLCEEFASVARCDEAVAQCYLAENEWEVEKALNSFFEPAEEEDVLDAVPAGAAGPPTCVDLTNEDTTDSTSSKSNSLESTEIEDKTMFSFITWNIDGLDINNLQERAQGVCSYLALYCPDVVFLQEVIPPYYCYLKKRATSYEIIPGREDGYFTAIMLRKARAKLKSYEIIPFPNTKMMRNILCAHVSMSGSDFYLMTSHLESTKEHSKERMSQLKMVFKKMQEAPEEATVVFGGDTNLRDQEVIKYGGLPDNIMDAWEFLGKPKHCQYTWDTQMNSNLGIPGVCKLRFDRIFFRTAAENPILPRSFDLLGMEKLDCGKYPSDHWGVLCYLDKIF